MSGDKEGNNITRARLEVGVKEAKRTRSQRPEKQAVLKKNHRLQRQESPHVSGMLADKPNTVHANFDLFNMSKLENLLPLQRTSQCLFSQLM